MKKLTILPLLLFAFSALAQEVNVVIEVSTSPVPGKKRVTVKYSPTGGSFEASNGTDEWNGQTITLGWLASSGMTPSAPGSNPNITSFTSPSGFSFVDNFSGNNNIISYTLDQLGGTADGKVYMTLVVNGSTSNQPITQGAPLTVFFFDIPNSWSGGPGTLFLLVNQPPGISIGLAPTILNSVLGQVWDEVEVAAALPVELLSFTARPVENSDALLEWTTASEHNSSHFEVEKSTDGRDWKMVDKVAAAGFSQMELDYRLTDRKVFEMGNGGENIFYYRLKMFDLDGSFEYSEVRKVEFEKEQSTIGELYPNPATRGIANVFLPLSIHQPAMSDISVFDMNGKFLRQFQTGLEPGDQQLTLHFKQLPAGTYLFDIRIGAERFSKKLVVQ